MNTGMSLGLGQTQRLQMSTEQRLAQRIGLRTALVGALYGERLEPRAQCPNCDRRLELHEILKGFRPDAQDPTTDCPGCGHRFTAQLVAQSSATSFELTFLCPMQTQEQLKILAHQSPEAIKLRNQSAYRSALLHFGSLKAAFASIGVDYSQVDVEVWKDKVRPFLGKMSDALIAECAGVKIIEVRRFRKNLRIRASNAPKRKRAARR